MENKLNDLKPLYSRKKSFAFQEEVKENALAFEGINSCRLACTQTFYFSFRKERGAKRERKKKDRIRIFSSSPTTTPLTLAVNKSLAVYILSPALDGL